ncbi:MAG: glycosyltransferase [Halanaerobiaceae bacterium]|jgi:glycosyltransferase involved in cell wall biosynthesis|nr:glycosyltransferase [Halanaerobiaceae bacterium]
MADESIKKTGLVSVVIPTYNYGEYILDALEGLKKQTYPEIEVIIIDDGSFDNTPSIVQMWRASNPYIFRNFLYFPLPRNCSSSWALNIGFYLSQGEFVIIHDADDFSYENKLKIQVDWLQMHPETHVVGTCYDVVNIFKHFLFLPGWLSFDRKEIEANYKKGKHCVCFGTLMFRKEILKRVAGVKRIPEIRNDAIFIGEIINNGYIVDNINLILYTVRLHQKQKAGPKDFQKESFNIFEERVSIIIPVRFIKYIYEMLYRVATQTYHDLEVIVVNDQKESKTEIIIREWFNLYKELNPQGIIKDMVYLHLPVEVGNPWLYNIGLYLAKGKAVLLAGNNSLLNKEEIRNCYTLLFNNWPYSGIGIDKNGEITTINWNNDFVNNPPGIMADVSKEIYSSMMIKHDIVDRTAGLAADFSLQII